MKKLILLSAAFLYAVLAYPAYILSKDANGNDMWFETTSAATVEVVMQQSLSTDGAIAIPATITDNGTTYTVTSICTGAFSFTDITSVSIPNTVTVIGKEAFAQCLQLTSVSIGNGVTEIKESAFNNCTNLTSVDLGNSLTHIRSGAFHLCPVPVLVIPASVEYIGSNNFDEGHKAITCYATVPPVCETDAFGYYGDNHILAVPEASLSDYSTAPVWKDFRETRPAFEKREATIPLDEVAIGDILLSDGTLVKPHNFSKDAGNLPVGVVFYVCEPLKEAWVCSLTDQAKNVEWIVADQYPRYDADGNYIEGSFSMSMAAHDEIFLRNYNIDYPGADNRWSEKQALFDLDGEQNTAFISSATAPAAVAARSYGSNWYLPAVGQLRLLYANYEEVANTFAVLNANGVFAEQMFRHYFSSTECHTNTVFTVNEYGGMHTEWKSDYYGDIDYEDGLNNVRAVYTIPLLEANQTPQYKIGDLITNDDGTKGIVFYINPEQTEGWMVSLNYMTTGGFLDWKNNVRYQFSPGTTETPSLLPNTKIWDDLLPFATDYDGEANTQALKQQAGTSFATQYPAAYAATLLGDGWYLPAIGQLNQYFAVTPFIADAILQNGGDDILFPEVTGNPYWSSTTLNNNVTLRLSGLLGGDIDDTDNQGAGKVRPVKSFTIPQDNPIIITLTFDPNGGSAVESPVTANYNTIIAAPVTTRTGYTFNGWYNGGVAFDFSTPITEDITLTAHWTINQYTVTFNSNEGYEVAPVTTDYNTTITAPEEPTRTGYTFDGWFTEETFETEWNFETDVVTQNITLYAKWNSEATGIADVSATEEKIVVGYFNLFGQQLSQKPANGLYFILYNNGTCEKVIVE